MPAETQHASARPGSSAAGPSRRRPLPVGLAPGTLVADPGAHPTGLRLLDFGPEELAERDLASVAELEPPAAGVKVRWLDVTGLADVAALAELGRRLDLHPLVLEDVVNTHQRPKVEPYGDDVFIVARMGLEDAEGCLATEQISLLVRPGLVITFQERPGDCFDPVRRRIRSGGPRLRNGGADYLAYALLDALVDGYQPMLERFEDTLEELEDAVLDDAEAADLKVLHRVRRDLIALRRVIVPLREAVYALTREPSPTIRRETHVFLRDCYDHVIRMLEQLDSQRELGASLMDVHLTLASNRTNDVMKVLTIIATIFIPLSFLAGLYGMNFDTSSPWNMPELRWRFGYPAVLAAMVVVALAFVAFLKRKGWL
ncbi:MAG: magnesium and cobalt transport protein CorA [Acidobacteria bacterium]|nr:MAG: magnesium and cobalt transport protein CorA [Acidobacteriota bacterium]